MSDEPRDGVLIDEPSAAYLAATATELNRMGEDAAALILGSGAPLVIHIGEAKPELIADWRKAKAAVVTLGDRERAGKCRPADAALARFLLEPLVERCREKIGRGKASRPDIDWFRFGTLLRGAYPPSSDARIIGISEADAGRIVAATATFTDHDERPIRMGGRQSWRMVQMLLSTLHVADVRWQRSLAVGGSTPLTIPLAPSVVDLVPSNEVLRGNSAYFDNAHHAAQRVAIALGDILGDPSLNLTLDQSTWIWAGPDGQPVALAFDPGIDFGLIAERQAHRGAEPMPADWHDPADPAS